MVSPENTSWFYDYEFKDVTAPGGNFSAPNPGFPWPMQTLNGPSNARSGTESCAPSTSKACREKLRRDRLNDKFIELGALLDPGGSPKTDKTAALVDAVRMVTQLRGEAQKLKGTNSNLQEKIKELKMTIHVS